MKLLKQGPKPKWGCLRVASVPALAAISLLIWLVTA